MYGKACVRVLPSLMNQHKLIAHFKKSTRDCCHSSIKIPVENASGVGPWSPEPTLQESLASVWTVGVAEVYAVATHKQAWFEESVLVSARWAGAMGELELVVVKHERKPAGEQSARYVVSIRGLEHICLL